MYKNINGDFDAQYKPSKTYLENLYASEYMQHFYSEREIEIFFTKALKQ